ncbi:endonuclease/exonuclease/phosphatase family protein [Gammaproteobacteria bacterium]|nr:endonuclease/exonuclease/phosphatase family protein [Gammaproteobacteria bacterium]
MEILTWNIQAGTGVDGNNDMSRIAQVIKDTGNPDIICLQEVARNFPPVDGESCAYLRNL